MATLDHLIVATDDLDRTVAGVEAALGVRASAGGSHVGRGTRNELLSLGDRSYLELIGRDDAQPEPRDPRPFGVDRVVGERLVGWAVAVDDIETVCTSAIAHGYDPGPIAAMQRATPGGSTLAWRLTPPAEGDLAGVVPFLIDWGTLSPAAHPSATATPGARLLDMRAEHPSAEIVQQALRAIGVDLRIEPGPTTRLMARLRGPAGELVLE